MKANSCKLVCFIVLQCVMGIRQSAHNAYHEYNIVWIPKYKKWLLKGDLKQFFEQRLRDVEAYHPEVEIEKYSIQLDRVHPIIVIPLKHAASAILGKIKVNTSRAIRKEFEWIKKIYSRNEFWSPVYSSSTVEINEAIIERYVEFQEKMDKEWSKLGF